MKSHYKVLMLLVTLAVLGSCSKGNTSQEKEQRKASLSETLLVRL